MVRTAWVYGGPKGTIHAVEALTGIKINHMIVVDLGNFPKFIDAIGGVEASLSAHKTDEFVEPFVVDGYDGGYYSYGPFNLILNLQ